MKHKAFTLIELLVTVAIVGILAGVAIAQYAEYRARANDSLAISAVRNAWISLEAKIADHVGNPLLAAEAAFFGTAMSVCSYTIEGLGATGICTNPNELLPGFTPQNDIHLRLYYNNPSGTASTRIYACHCKGSPYGQGDYADASANFAYTSDTKTIIKGIGGDFDEWAYNCSTC